MEIGKLGRLVLALGSALGSACIGDIGEPVGQDTAPLCGESVRPGPSPIRRLTRFEYDNTVRDLLGDDSNPSRDFPPEEEALGFNNNAATLGVTQLLAEQYMVASEGIAERATTPAQLVPTLGCDPAVMGESACVADFAARFGQRAWRRPLTTDEIATMVALYDQVRASYDFTTGVQVVMQAFLQSPHFLYRVEFGAPPAAGEAYAPLGGYEMASRLSYFLWGSMPDDALFAAAAAGELVTPAQIAAQARRLLDDPRSHAAVRNFHTQWLKLDLIEIASKDATLFPGYSAAVKASLREETLAFVDDVLWSGDGSVDTLLTAPYTMMDATLASYYGVTGPAGAAFERVELDPAKYSGLLTQAGLLSALAKPNQTSPVLRGKFVREQLLCQILPAPPPDVDVTPPDLDPNLTTRERFAEHSANPVCAGCHRLMDPIGFGFENFDGAGRFRADENGLPIDASGEVVSAADATGTFDGVPGLAQQLATSDQVRSCVTTQWFRFAYGRVETGADECSMEQLAVSFEAGGYDIKELLIALTQTDAFLYRIVTQGGQ